MCGKYESFNSVLLCPLFEDKFFLYNYYSLSFFIQTGEDPRRPECVLIFSSSDSLYFCIWIFNNIIAIDLSWKCNVTHKGKY